MRAVPREEILHPVDAGNGEMERILGRLRGQRLPGDEQRGECNRRIRHVQEREALEYGEASLGRFGGRLRVPRPVRLGR